MNSQDNLVPNGGFEELNECPIGADLYNLKYWFSPSNGTPDFFNSCAPQSNNYSVPINSYGYQTPFEGEAYVGIVPYSFTGNYREYICVKLKNRLQKNKLYKINFKVSVPDSSPVVSNNLSFGFFNDSVFFDLNSVVNPDSFVENDSIYGTPNIWNLYENYYISNGNESYFVLGNFKTDGDTKFKINANTNTDPYYFIDDITLLEVNFENIFTPNGDGINDLAFYNSNISNLKILIFNRWGNEVKLTNFTDGWDGKDNNSKDMNDGIYFYSIYNNKKNINKIGYIQLIR